MPWHRHSTCRRSFSCAWNRRWVLLMVMAAALAPNSMHAVRLIPGSSRMDPHAQEQPQQQETESVVATASWRHRQLSQVITENNSAGSTPKGTTSHQQRETRRVEVTVAESPDDHLVQSLPLMDDASFQSIQQQWAGHLPASADGTKYFFYWLFAPDATAAAVHGDNADIPLLIWLNGGPGCSSMDGLFLENGPLQWAINSTTNQFYLQLNPYSWHNAPAYTLYIDQPVGTGLSFTTEQQYPDNDEKLAVDFDYFLQQFLQLHADKFVATIPDVNNNNRPTLSRRLFFSGESYAGHYIPVFISYLLQRNHEMLADNSSSLSSKRILVPVHGAAIGNGWVDPFYQYSGAEASYGHGLIGLSEVAALAEKEKTCQADLLKQKYYSPVCFELIDAIVRESMGKDSNNKVCSYNVHLIESRNSPRSFPPNHKVVESYLGGWDLPHNHPGKVNTEQFTYQDVLRALHASAAIEAGVRFLECTDPPYDALSDKDGKGVVDQVVTILDAGVRMLFFNGMLDLVCNHVGNERFLQHMPWQHTADWIQAERFVWLAPSDQPIKQQQQAGVRPPKVSGYIRQFANLLFLKLVGSGHMVPMDTPAVALDMMQTFMFGGSFTMGAQELERANSVPDRDGGNCPICPDCPDVAPSTLNNEHDANNVNNKSGPSSEVSEMGIGTSWGIAGSMVIILLLATIWYRWQSFHIGTSYYGTGWSAASGSGVPVMIESAMDLEMEVQNGNNSATYRDEPVDPISGTIGNNKRNGEANGNPIL